MSTLEIFFLACAILGLVTFLYALRTLGPAGDAEKQVMELQERMEQEES